MPQMDRDPHSGALIFTSTPEEEKMNKTVENVQGLQDSHDELLKRVEELEGIIANLAPTKRRKKAATE